MHNYLNDEQNIIDKNREFSLSLRKREIYFKLFEGRYISGFNNKKISSIFDEKNEISIIKSKFNNLQFELDIDEEILLDNLSELLSILESFIIKKKKIVITEELIEQSIIDKIYKNILFNKYINQEEILTKILTLLSEVLFLYNKIPNLSIYKNKFISNNEYINLFFSLINSDSDEIIYKTYKFIGLLADNSEEISIKLYNDKILEQIINNHKYDDIDEIISVKVWLISNFNSFLKLYASDLELSFNIQKFYIYVFKEFIFNKNYGKELLDNLVKILMNLSLCKNDIYLKNILDSKIISFILNIDQNNSYKSANNLLIILGNMSSTDNSEILLELYKESIHYLINIISSNNMKDYAISLALWTINNFTEDNNIYMDIFLKNDLISIYKNYILKNISIDENIFNEICLSFQNFILRINRNKDFYLLKKYNIISLVVDGFKKIGEIRYLNKIGFQIIKVLFLLFNNKNKDIANFSKTTFLIKGGYEYILYEIRNLFYEEKIKNFRENDNDSSNNDENDLLKYIDLIEKRFLNN